MQQLRQRLKDHKGRKKSSSGDDDCECEAIPSTLAKAGGTEDDSKRKGKEALEQAPESEDLGVRVVRGEVYVRNSSGLDLDDMKERLRIVEQNVADKREKAADERKKAADEREKMSRLEQQVLTLRLAGQDYRRVRNRFISTFKRDKLQHITPGDTQIITQGSFIVHGGDASVDASLYEGPGARLDHNTFIALYGLDPYDVRNICE